MEVAISHRNHNIAGPHPDGTASLIVGGMVRIEGQRGLGQYQGGLLPLCKNIFGFVAKLCQASYKSNAKTTYRTHPPEHPHRQSRESGNPGQGRFPSPFALSLSKGPPPPAAPAGPHSPTRVIPAKAGIQRGHVGHPLPPTPVASPTSPYPVAGTLPNSVRPEPVEGPTQAHPDTSPWRPGQRPRYPSPMQRACNDLNQDIASASASENRRLFRTGAKVENRSL